MTLAELLPLLIASLGVAALIGGHIVELRSLRRAVEKLTVAVGDLGAWKSSADMRLRALERAQRQHPLDPERGDA